jgi:pyruvate dehydrogenase E2 component (dihydrolipoamide acetyltransferase)
MSTIEVKVPDIGDFTDIPIIEIFVKPGDTVKAEDSLITLESDKATMDVPSPAAGRQEVQGEGRRQGERRLADRDRVDTACRRGTRPAMRKAAAARRAIGRLPERPARSAGGRPRHRRPPRLRGASQAGPPRHRSRRRRTRVQAAHASPSVRKFARELGVDLAA